MTNSPLTEENDLISALMQGFEDSYVERLTYRAAAEIARLEEALARSEAQSVGVPDGWRTIESAPFEDVPLGSSGETTRWLDWCFLGRFDAFGFVSWVGGMDADAWLIRSDNRACEDSADPTHWQPLPAPPVSALPLGGGGLSLSVDESARQGTKALPPEGQHSDGGG